ncbi:MAG: oxepin-CoA hydrolase, alternative type [Pikeienuella sp.]
MTRVLTERHGRVLHLINNAPDKRNALDFDYYDAVIAALDAAGDDIGAVVLSGAGHFFCAGGDLKGLKARSEKDFAGRREGVDRLHGLIRAIRACPKPVIAAVDGGAAGAGASLAAACDLIVAAEDAYVILAYVKIGLTPDGGATWFYGRGLPPQLTAEMAITGGKMPAARLYQAGFINRIAPVAVDAALEWAAEIANGAPHSMAAIKGLLGQAQTNSLEEQLEAEAQGIGTALGGAEGKEGINAFLEKRKANFHG